MAIDNEDILPAATRRQIFQDAGLDVVGSIRRIPREVRDQIVLAANIKTAAEVQAELDAEQPTER